MKFFTRSLRDQKIPKGLILNERVLIETNLVT